MFKRAEYDADDEQGSCLDEDWVYFDDIAESYSLPQRTNHASCSSAKRQAEDKEERCPKKQKKRNGRKPFNRWST